jgi:hypothetical protein
MLERKKINFSIERVQPGGDVSGRSLAPLWLACDRGAVRGSHYVRIKAHTLPLTTQHPPFPFGHTKLLQCCIPPKIVSPSVTLSFCTPARAPHYTCPLSDLSCWCSKHEAPAYCRSATYLHCSRVPHQLQLVQKLGYVCVRS